MRPHTDAPDAGFRHLLICGFVLVTLVMGMVTGAGAQQVLFPDSPAGWTAQLRDHRDVSAYLAFHKAQAAGDMAAAIARGQTPNQATYDVRFYDLDLDLDPGARVLTGTVGIEAEVVAGPFPTTPPRTMPASQAASAAHASGGASGYRPYWSTVSRSASMCSPGNGRPWSGPQK